MNIFTKSPEQLEIMEICSRLDKDYGMKNAEIARELNLTRSYVGYLAQGKRNPPARTLQDFRDLESRRKAIKAHGEEITTSPSELEHIYDRIAIMEKHDRPNFEVVKRIVESLTPTNSKADGAAKRLLKKASVSAIKSDPK